MLTAALRAAGVPPAMTVLRELLIWLSEVLMLLESALRREMVPFRELLI